MYVEEVVGEVEALGLVGGGGSLFEDGRYGDVGQAGGYGLPFFMGSEVGVEFYVAVVEWFEFFRVEVEWVNVEGFVYPGYVVEGVLDSFAGLGVVEHDFAASDVVVLVYLPEDGCGGPVF